MSVITEPDLTEEQEALSRVAWGLLHETVHRGQMTLPEGGVRPVNTPELVRLLQWMAGLTPRRVKSVPPPKDLFMAKTSGPTST